MILDARVLQPEFIPQEVKHRSAEVGHLSDTLRPVMDGNHAETSFLYGPSGTGKTCIAQYTVERLRENTFDLTHQYVNGWEDYTRFKTLYRILDGISSTVDIHRKSTPKDELLERLRRNVDDPYIVILDEVDQLEDKSLLYDLYRIPNLAMILIANREEDVFAHLDDRLNSRLSSSVRIRFGRYNLAGLTAILEDRVHWGLVDGTLDQEGMELIADKAAGDARKAIGILRNAAQTASYNNLDTIPHSVIEDSVSETKSEIQQKTIGKLTDDQRVLYEILTEDEEIDPATLYDQYTDRVDDAKSKRMVRNYLAKLEHYNLIVSEGQTKGRIYRLKRVC
jgi:orc1/cdc6 family replication initiation protein